MKPRSHSLNQVVWVTMTAIDAVPTIRVQRTATTWSDLRANDILIPEPSSLMPSEGLADAEVHAEGPFLWLAVDEKAFDRIDLKADVEAYRTNRRLVAEAGTRRVAQVAQVETPGIGPDVADVEKRRGAELSL